MAKNRTPVLETLDPRDVTAKVQTLARRVAERFPTRGLTQAVMDLAGNAAAIADDARSLSRRNPYLQFMTGVLLLSGLAAAVYVLGRAVSLNLEVPAEIKFYEFFSAIQGVEAIIHIIALTAGGMYFLVTLDRRARRQRALEGLYSLRAYAHVIDIHQLNKDPSALAAGLAPARSSPDRDLPPRELLRYLDSCSEMLAMISKLAALYAQYSRDPVVMDTVNGVEMLTTSLSNHIWQKIAVLNASLAHGREGEPPKALTASMTK